MTSATPRHSLYFMIKPPPDVWEELTRLAPRSKRLASLHITLFWFGDWPTPPPNSLIARLRQTGDRLCARPFRLAFDELIGAEGLLLIKGSEPNRGLLRFRALLSELVAADGISLPRYDFVPHLTLDYGSRMQGRWPIDTVSWTVDDFLLIESVGGTHVEHARWRLTGGSGAVSA